MKKEYLYVVLYNNNVANIGFKDLEKAFDWLKTNRESEQIQGLQFTKGFSIKPVEIVE